MVDFPHGLPGGPAASPVGPASRRGVDCAVNPIRPMAGSHAKARIQKCETVKTSYVQWMVTGQSGALGKNAQRAVDVATEPGPELAIIHLPSMVGGRVKGMLWK